MTPKMLIKYPANPRYFIVVAGLGLLTVFVLVYNRGEAAIWRQSNLWLVGGLGELTASLPSLPITSGKKDFGLPKDSHAISELIRNAHTSFLNLLQNQSHTLAEAAAAYRARRGRHPPPGFARWFKEARKRKAVIVEDFFDRIHHDINPFWGRKPHDLRQLAHSAPQVIRVREGNASFETDDPNRPPFIQLWTALVGEMAPHLPDLDMPVNVMDESRLLVPWDKIEAYVTQEGVSKKLLPPEEVEVEYTGYEELDAHPTGLEPKWITNQANRYWDHLKAACPPDSPARKFSSLERFDGPISDLYPLWPAPYTHEGFVQNFTASMDVCHQPHLRGMHGTFIESVSMSTSHDLIPMFGGCKLAQNNEILIPGAMYLTKDLFYEGGKDESASWAKKKDGLIWRGVASGGRNRADNWWHIHRHRWAQMMNGSTVRSIEAGDRSAAPTFRLPPSDSQYRDIPAAKRPGGSIGDWLETFSNVSFNNLECFPMARDEEGRQNDLGCPHTNDYFHISDMVPMTEQYGYKYLPDVDGHSYSARWRGFLRSSSCPLKATIYAEWHDDRLVPWVHFVPFDSSYQDIWAVMDYFLNGHDAEGARIAKQSSEWAAKVLRRDDMLLYVWRLLLEYARVVDPKRERLGFVEDLRLKKWWSLVW